MRLGIIGCGNMGSALAKGIISKKILPFNRIFISDKDSHKTKALNRKYGALVVSNKELAHKSDFIVIAVKPQDSRQILAEIKDDLSNHKHLISIMAGVEISKIEAIIKNKIAITRAMPNVAVLVGKSMTALSHNKMVKNKTIVSKLFLAVGDILEIDEKHMDAVTAVSGSGPAYFYHMAEALRDAAVKLGIKKEKADILAATTLVGSGALLNVPGHDLTFLKNSVTSRRGTTEAALKVLKDKNFNKIIRKAVASAAKRAKEISRGV